VAGGRGGDRAGGTGLLIDMTDGTAANSKKLKKLASTISDSDHISYELAQWSSD
jgi:hypothetical protein